MAYGSCAGQEAAPGQPSIERLVLDYDLPRLHGGERCFGIIGNPVSHSLSPRLHNGAYRDLGISAAFLPFHADSFGDFWLEVVEGDFFANSQLELAGFAVTAPHKSAALASAGVSSPRAQLIRSANTLVRNGLVWEAESTDPEGVVGPLRARDALGGKALVVGCGGAGRAAALGLRDTGSEVTLTNRTAERGRRVAETLDLAFESREDLDLNRFEVVVHATALGHSASDPLPFDPESLRDDALVIDLVYDRSETPLLRACRERGLSTVDGVEVLLHQAVEQFRCMTGEELPRESGERRLRATTAELLDSERVGS